MPTIAAPHHPSESSWPIRRAIVLWLAASAALWIPIAIGAYWLLRAG